MAVEFSVLASGSRGNASLVRSGGSGVLIDLGLGPRAMATRLESVGSRWEQVAAAVLTHTHGDHVGDATLRALGLRGIPFYCHEDHRPRLGRFSGFAALLRADRVRFYDDRPFLLPNGARVEPIELSHDSGPTFGFRIEARPGRKGRAVALGYLADTGCWKPSTADALADVDLLGVEFNHDVEMQRNSGRAPYLIARNLGKYGHLSNDQGADLVSAVIERSGPGALKHVVLLHLSEHCNHPGKALTTAREAVKRSGRRSRVHVAEQFVASPHLPLSAARAASRKPREDRGFPWEDTPEPALFRLDAG